MEGAKRERLLHSSHSIGSIDISDTPSRFQKVVPGSAVVDDFVTPYVLDPAQRAVGAKRTS